MCATVNKKEPADPRGANQVLDEHRSFRLCAHRQVEGNGLNTPAWPSDLRHKPAVPPSQSGQMTTRSLELICQRLNEMHMLTIFSVAVANKLLTVDGSNVMIAMSMVGISRLPQFRVTVNSRCGHRCFYCRPSGEAVDTAAGIQLAPDALLKVAGSVRRQGIDSIKLTGGDPALYRPLVSVAEALKREAGFAHVEVISRHPRIGTLAIDLAAAGIDQVNISLDTVDAAKHAQICGVDDLPNLLFAIESCVAAGLTVKVNTVVMAGINDQEIHDVIDRCANMGVTTVKLLDVIDDLDRAGASFTMRIPGGNSTPFDPSTLLLTRSPSLCDKKR